MITLKSLSLVLLRVFRRIKRIIRKKTLLLTNPRFRKHLTRIGKIRKKRTLLDELSKLLLEEKNIPPEFIWDIVAAEKNLRELALQLFLNHPELSFGHIYEAAVNMPDNKKDADYLQNALWVKLAELGLSRHELMDMIMEWPQFFQEKALKEFIGRIEGKKIRKDDAKGILRTLIEKVPHLREPLWKIYKTLDLSSGELKNLLDAKWLYSIPGLAIEIELTARNANKREKAKKRYRAIIRERLNSILDKLAKIKKGLG